MRHVTGDTEACKRDANSPASDEWQVAIVLIPVEVASPEYIVFRTVVQHSQALQSTSQG
jgi:hypothetical protein